MTTLRVSRVRVSEDEFWGERIDYFLERVVPVATGEQSANRVSSA